MKLSRKKRGIVLLSFSAALLGGCVGGEILDMPPPQPARQAEKAPSKAVSTTVGAERTTQLRQEIAKLQQEEQWTQDQINQTVLELQGPKLLGRSTRDTVDLGDVGRHSADMTAQYEYKNRIKNKRIALEKELSKIEQQALGGGDGGGGGGGGGGGSH